MEEWKPIKGYENEYLISSAGNVLSIRNNRLLMLKHDKGYLRVGLSKNGKTRYFGVHRLVAEAFIPNPENKPTVNHINENKQNNRVENLEWATFREQNTHGTRIQRAMQNTDWKKRTAKMNYAEIAKKHDYENMNVSQMKKVERLDKNGNVVATYKSLGAAARDVATSTGHIWECCQGTRKTCKGSIWRYA